MPNRAPADGSGLEKQYLDQLRRLSPEVLPVAEDCIRLFENAYSRRPETVCTLRSPVLMERMTFYLDRSMLYSNLYERWTTLNNGESAHTLFNRESAINVFGPLLLQELEGPLKTILGITRFLIGVDVGEDSKWPGSLIRDPSTGQQHTFGHLFSEIRKRAGRYPGLSETMEAFEGTDEKLDFEILRNALGHSDYWLVSEPRRLRVHLEAGENSQVMEADEFLSLFTGVQDLLLGLQIAVLVVMHRLGKR